MLWDSWIETLSHSLLTKELRRKSNLLRAYSEERNGARWVRKRMGYVASTTCEGSDKVSGKPLNLYESQF